MAEDPLAYVLPMAPLMYYGGIFFTAEAFSLYAIASGARSTTLALTTAGALLMLLCAVVLDLVLSLEPTDP